MSTCPVPDKAKTTSYATPSAAVVAPPTPVDESCSDPGGLKTEGAPGVTSTMVEYIPVAGPMGPQGYCGKGFQWVTEDWAIDKVYYTWEQGVVCNASTIAHAGTTYVCIQTHIATPENEPGQFWDQGWRAFWDEMAAEGSTGPLGIANKLKSFLENAFDYVMDIPNWGVGDWIKTIAGVAAAAWVGTKVVDMIESIGEVDEETGESADSRFTGSPGLAATPVAPTLPAVVARLCERAGLAPNQYDVTQLPVDQLVYGAALTGSTADVLSNLKYIYGFDIVKATQKLVFIPYNLPVVIEIPMSDIGFENSKSSLSRFSVQRLQSNDLPRRVALTFKSSDLSYHEDQEKAELFSYSQGQEVAVTLPFVLTNQQAKDIAERALVQAHSQANTLYFSLPYKYMELQPGDNIACELGILRIITIDENPNNVLNVTAVSADEVEYALQSSGQPPRVPQSNTNAVQKVVFTQGILMDLPPLDASDNQPRVYAAVHGYNNKDWSGCTIYETRDNGETYDAVGTTGNTQSTVGIVDTKIAAVAEDKYFVWDDVTQIDVRVKTNELISAPSDLAVYNGANLCIIGSELIAFRYATLTGVDEFGNKMYRLTRLLRGLRGTEWVIPHHVDQELFCMIDSSLIEIPFPMNERGRARTYRFVSFGSDESKAKDQQITPYMINLVPWRVAHPSGAKLGGTNDFGFSWTERPAFDNEMQAYRQSTKDSDWAGWTVAVLNPSNLEDIKYTEHVVEPNFTFTEALQLQAFGSLQSCVYLKIITMSRNVGGGYDRIICAS